MEEQKNKDCYHDDDKSGNTHEKNEVHQTIPGNNSCGSYYISDSF
jgi:hypothetical protein